MVGGLCAFLCIAWAALVFWVAAHASAPALGMEGVDRILIFLIAFAPRLIGFALWIIAKARITGTKSD
jgi:hypothetical protein